MSLQSLKEKYFNYSTFAKNSAILFFANLIVGILSYIYHLIIGRQVSVTIYGEAESLISLIAIISVPASTLAMVATKYAATCKADGNKNGSYEILAYLNKKVFKYGFPIFLLAVISTPIIGRFLNIENNFSLILIWMSMYISFFGAVNGGLLSGWQKFKEISVANVSSAIIKLISGVAMVAVGFALGGIVGSLVLSTVAGYVVTLWFLKASVAKKPSTIDTHYERGVDFKSLKRYIIPVFAGNLAITILGYADMVMAKHNLSDLLAGQYGALTVVSKIIFFATGVVASVLFSMSAEHSHKGESSLRILKVALWCVIGASLFATLIYFLYPTLILGVLFGNKYQDVAPYLGWFAIVVTLYSISNVIFQYLLSLRKTKISYAFLAIALATVMTFMFFGQSIRSMLIINIASQTIAIVVGGLFLFERSKIKQTI